MLFLLAVILLAWLALELGQWQFHRLDQRKHDNGVVATNLAAAPVPVEDLLGPGRNPEAGQEWRRVTVHGTWDDRHTIVLKYQTRDTQPGVEVVTPLVTRTGAAVLVDRGWMSSDNSGASRPAKMPATTDGEVTVTGWVRRDATGSSTRVSDLSTRAVSSQRISEVLPYDVYGGFVDLALESPRAATTLAAVELPDDTSNGPHFFYGLQWWFFGALAVFGFCYLAFDEVRRHRRRHHGRPQGPGVTSPGASRRPRAASSR